MRIQRYMILFLVTCGDEKKTFLNIKQKGLIQSNVWYKKINQ